MQKLLFDDPVIASRTAKPLRTQLLKWIGNKQRFAERIVSDFPEDFGTYIEPFPGSGAVVATLGQDRSIGADTFHPLMDIWQTLSYSPDSVKDWHTERWHFLMGRDKKEAYEIIKAHYNAKPNGADLLFLCRSCYGGVVRFREECDIPLCEGLFERQVFLDCGQSMLKRFQMNGLSLEDEVVHDRLLLTYRLPTIWSMATWSPAPDHLRRILHPVASYWEARPSDHRCDGQFTTNVCDHD